MKPNNYLLPLISAYQNNAQPNVALQMEKYMRNLFSYYGIKSPVRKDIYRNFKNTAGLIPEEHKSNIVKWCWQAPQREYQYFAMEFLRMTAKKESKQILELYEYMVVTKSWWDTVDFIASNLLGAYFKNYPDEINTTTQRWMLSNNIWLQRSCLLFQLKYKTNIDTDLLHGFILKLVGSNEFFIQKAIGWILREYSKTNPNFVIEYVNNNKLAPLSRREALLWMKNKGIN